MNARLSLEACGERIALCELEKYVDDKVRSGLYPSASEVIGESLRLLRERDEADQKKLEDCAGEIALGIEQADRGEVSTFNEETLKEIKAEGRKELAAECRRKRS